MKATLVLDVDIRGNEVWLAECYHPNSKTCGSWRKRQVFVDEKDARKWMEKQVINDGSNLLNFWQEKRPDKGYHMTVIQEQYDCEAHIMAGKKKADKVVGMLHLLTIN